MRSTRIELIGVPFGRLIVMGHAGMDKDNRQMWRCQCVCGKFCSVSGKNLRGGLTQSCGCLQKERTAQRSTTHGQSRSLLHGVWGTMLSRCTNPNCKAWPRYGGAGITVCERWKKSFADFLEDMGERPPGMSLDRKNPFGNYEPGNCRWATKGEQVINQKRHLALAVLNEADPLWHEKVEMGQKPIIQWSPAKAFEEGYTKV